MKKTLAAVVCGMAALAAGTVGGCASDVNEADLDKVAIRLADVKKEFDKGNVGSKVLLVDARGAADYQAKHLPGAMNVGVSSISGTKGDVDARLAKYNTLIVYGDDPGTGSARALAKKMLAAGYKNVRYFPEGLRGWEGAKYPVEGAGGK